MCPSPAVQIARTVASRAVMNSEGLESTWSQLSAPESLAVDFLGFKV